MLLSILLILSFCDANAQTDVVFLKNGSIIREIVIEQFPNQSVKLQTSDKSILAFRMDEILKITKEDYEKTDKDKIKPKPEWKANRYVSAALNFARPYAGLLVKHEFAVVGFSTGVSYHHEFFRGFGLTGGYIFQRNKADESSFEDSHHYPYNSVTSEGAWTFHDVLIGPQIFLKPARFLYFDVYTLAGIQFGGGPTIIYNQSSASDITRTSYSRKPSIEILLGWNFRFNFTGRISPFINAEFKNSQSKVCESTNGSNISHSFYYKSRYMFSNIGAGIAILMVKSK